MGGSPREDRNRLRGFDVFPLLPPTDLGDDDGKDVHVEDLAGTGVVDIFGRFGVPFGADAPERAGSLKAQLEGRHDHDEATE